MLYILSTTNSALPAPKIIIGCRTNMDLTKYGPKRKGLNNIVYVISGKGYFNGNLVAAGQGFLLYSGPIVEYFPDEDDPMEYLWFASADISFRSIMDSYQTIGDTQIFNHNSTNNLKQLCNTVIDKNGSLVTPMQTLEMFLRIYNNHGFDFQSRDYKKNSKLYIEHCVNFIGANINNPITVGSLLNITGVSQPYLHKLFLHNLGMSPKQYILQQKLDRASVLLKSTDMTITQIADSIGYDVLSFSKLFKKKKQVSPQKYRAAKERKA